MFKGCYAGLKGIFKRLMKVEAIEIKIVDVSMGKSIEDIAWRKPSRMLYCTRLELSFCKKS